MKLVLHQQPNETKDEFLARFAAKLMHLCLVNGGIEAAGLNSWDGGCQLVEIHDDCASDLEFVNNMREANAAFSKRQKQLGEEYSGFNGPVKIKKLKYPTNW